MAELVPAISRLDEGRGRLRRAAACAVLALGAAWAGALRDGFHEPPVAPWVLVTLQALQLGLLLLGLSSLNPDFTTRTPNQMLRAWLAAAVPPRIRKSPPPSVPPTGVDAFILGALPLSAIVCWIIGWPRLAIGFLDTASLLAALIMLARLGLLLLRRLNAPQLLLPATFLLLVLSGTCLLKLPRAAGNEEIGWIDSLFTATSAVCVTGLAVRSTSEGFSFAGQFVILLLMQLGGLGIVVFGATFAALLRGTLSLREHITVRDLLEHNSVADLRRFAMHVVLVTVGIQLVGGLAMLPFWDTAADESLAMSDRAWLSAFHAVSAFCNAGFDITGESLVPYRRSPLGVVFIGFLVILGGIGFPVLFDVSRRATGWVRFRVFRRGNAPTALHLHSRLTLNTTLILLFGGAALLFVAQLGRPIGDAGSSLLVRASDAWFMSLTARTAGFNSVPMEELSPASVMMLIALMFIGGSPGSMAGGFKTTTLAVLFLAALATIRGRAETEAGGRAIPEDLVRKAGAVALCMLGLVLASTFLLCLFEPHKDPFKLLFESVSAATTTGLSLGITPGLSPAGKLVLAATMFLGRVGPLTLMSILLIRRPPSRAYLYPRETVTLG